METTLCPCTKRAAIGESVKVLMPLGNFEDMRTYTREQIKQKFFCSERLLNATARVAAVAIVPLYGAAWWTNERLVGLLSADTETDEGAAVLANPDTQNTILEHARLVEKMLNA